MACTLHVPINDEDEEKENDGENPVNIVEIDKANNINQWKL